MALANINSTSRALVVKPIVNTNTELGAVATGSGWSTHNGGFSTEPCSQQLPGRYRSRFRICVALLPQLRFLSSSKRSVPSV
jgi:hypothetical protein